MDISSKDLIIFDLDGTLTPAKSPMTPDMAGLFTKLLEKKKIAVISGGGYQRFEIQFMSSLPTSADNFRNLTILPTSGGRLMTWKGSWVEEYAVHLAPKEKEVIMTSLNAALKEAGYVQPEKIFGQLIEDRGPQITFSALGQDAPLDLKIKWDPTREKRQKIVEILKAHLPPQFDARLGGTTSIDVTKRGINKAYGIHNLEKFLKIPLDKMVFIGDTLFYGGNDYPAKTTGVDCIQVSGPEETAKLIRSWL